MDNGGKKELTDRQGMMMQKAMARGKEIVEFFNLGVNLRLVRGMDEFMAWCLAVNLLRKDRVLSEGAQWAKRNEGKRGLWQWTGDYYKGRSVDAEAARAFLDEGMERAKGEIYSNLNESEGEVMRQQFQTIDRVAHLLSSAYTQEMEDSLGTPLRKVSQGVLEVMGRVLASAMR